MLPCRLCDCVLKCGDSDGATCHCSPNRIVTLVPANLNLNTRDGKLVFDKANNSKRLCVLFHHTQMRPSLSQPDPMYRDPLIQIIELSWPQPLIGQFSNCLNPGHPVIKLSSPPPPQAGLQGVVFKENCPGTWVPFLRLTQTFIFYLKISRKAIYPKSPISWFLLCPIIFSNIRSDYCWGSALLNWISLQLKIVIPMFNCYILFWFTVKLYIHDSWLCQHVWMPFKAQLLKLKFFWRLKRCPGISLTALAHVEPKLQISVKRLNVNYSFDQKYYQGQARF